MHFWFGMAPSKLKLSNKVLTMIPTKRSCSGQVNQQSFQHGSSLSDDAIAKTRLFCRTNLEEVPQRRLFFFQQKSIKGDKISKGVFDRLPIQRRHLPQPTFTWVRIGEPNYWLRIHLSYEVLIWKKCAMGSPNNRYGVVGIINKNWNEGRLLWWKGWSRWNPGTAWLQLGLPPWLRDPLLKAFTMIHRYSSYPPGYLIHIHVMWYIGMWYVGSFRSRLGL